MTGNTGDKVRAVFLAFLMVVSVFGMTAGLAGSAAAAASNLTVDDGAPAQPDGTVTVSVDVGELGNESSFLIEDSAESVADYGTITDGGANDADGSEDGVVTAELDLAGNFGGANPVDGIATVYASEGTSVTTNDAEETATFAVDGTAPQFGYSQPEGTVTTTTPEIVQNISDEVSGVDEETIHVTITRDSDGEYYTYTIDPTADNDGVDYVNGNLTVQPGVGDVPELEDHSSYTVEVSASDNAGNGPASTSFGFDVDTDAHLIEPQFTFDQPGETVVGDPAQIVQVSVESPDSASTTTAIKNANITITNGTDNYSYTFQDGDTVWAASNGDGTFAVDASEGGDIPALPNGTIVVEVNATNDQDNYAEETFSFEVDNIPPNAEDVSLSDGEIYEGNNAGEENVTVTFDEPVDPASVVVEARDGATVATIDQALAANEDLTQVTLAFDVSDLGATTNASAEVEVVDAQDLVGNSLNRTANASFAIDTDLSAPSIGTVGDTNVLSGYVNFTDDVTPSQDEDVVSTNYYLLKGGDGAYDPADDREDLYELETPSHTDTRELSEGRHTFVVYSTDDSGNEEFDIQKVTIDNWDVVWGFDGEEPLTGEVNITEVFTAYNTGTEEPTYYYAKDPADADNQSEYVQADSFEVDEDATYYLAAEVPDPGYEGDPNDVFLHTGGIEGQTLDADLTVDVNEETGISTASHGQGTFTVNVTSDMPLDSLHVDGFTDDGYLEQGEGHFGLDHFEQVDADDGYKYTLTLVAPRDGKYDFVLKNAGSGDLELGYQQSVDDVVIDANDPRVVDADVTDGGEDQLIVNVTFDEPVYSPHESAFAVDGVDASAVSVSNTGQYGYAEVAFDSEFQTGDGPVLVVSEGSVDEIYGSDANSEQLESIDTIELSLEAGENVVSIPSEAGTVDLDSELGVSTSSHVANAIEAIWQYEDGEWQSYSPDADENDFTSLKGGEGYIVVTSQPVEWDVQAYNVVSSDAGDSPTAPTAERVEPGWNLVGHFQEGTQSTDRALKTIQQTPNVDNNVVRVLGATDGLNFADTDTMRAGEGYWVFVEDSDQYTVMGYEDGDKVSPEINSVTVDDRDEPDDTVTEGDNVNIAADVGGDVDAVHADASAIGGAESLELTDGDNDGIYTAEVTSIGALSSGEKWVIVTASNTDGLQATSVDNIVYDNDLSTLSIDSPDDGAINPSGSIVVSVDDNLSEVDNLDVQLQNSAGDTYDPDADGGSGAFTSTETTYVIQETSAGTYEFTLPDLNDDEYTIVADASDAEGNVDQVTSTFLVDTADPSVAITSPTNANPAYVNSGDTVAVDVDVSDANYDSGTLELIAADGSTVVDSAAVDSGTSTVALTVDSAEVTDGDQLDLELSASDKAGNTSETSEVDSVIVDDTAPTMDDAEVDNTNASQVELRFSEGVSLSADGTALTAADLSFNDTGTANTNSITRVDHNAGDATAVVHLDSGTEYETGTDEIQLDSDVEDDAGNVLASGATTTITNDDQ